MRSGKQFFTAHRDGLSLELGARFYPVRPGDSYVGSMFGEPVRPYKQPFLGMGYRVSNVHLQNFVSF